MSLTADRVEVLLVGKGPPDTGGIAAVLQALESDLEGAGVRPRLLNLTRPADYVAGRLSLFNLWRTAADALAVAGAARKADVVDVHSAFTPAVTMVRAGLLLRAARLRGARPVLHVHGGGLPEWVGARWKQHVLAWAARPASAVVAVSQGVEQALAQAGIEATVLPNGVDLRRFAPALQSRARPVILFAGLLTERKGVIDLLVASRLLLDWGHEHDLVLVGGRPDEGDEAEAAVRQAASGHEQFVGAVPQAEMPHWYQRADIFCLPSWYEAMPVSILEAMASGLPVVATGVGDVPAMVDRAVGRLVPAQDPHALAKALQDLVSDAGERTRLGQAARRRAETRYSLSGAVAARAELYRQVAGR